MKKIIALFITAVFAAMIIAGCGATGSNAGGQPAAGTSENIDIESLKTIGDIRQFSSDGYAYDDTKFVTVFETGGNYYRVEADLDKEASEALNALSFEDPDHDQKLEELIKPLKITKLENLSEQILPQEELDKLAGKKCEELFNNGWSGTSFYEEGKSAYLDYGPFQYLVTLSGDVAQTDDELEAMSQMTVDSIEYIGLASDALN